MPISTRWRSASSSAAFAAERWRSARPASSAPVDLPSQSFSDEKERIADQAAALVRDGETVILDAGTTTLAIAHALPDTLTDVVVVTNGLDIALALHAHPGVTVIVTGGRLKRGGRNARSSSLISPFGTTLLREINADLAFLCVPASTLSAALPMAIGKRPR